MKQFSQQFYKKAETTVKLQAAEKRELKERLVAYMEYHPLPAELKEKKGSAPVKSLRTTEPFTVVKVPFHALFKYGLSVAVLVLVVIPFVAEKAMPGDILYAVKVQFNEEVRSTITFDSFEKVEWETERLNRRIAEARLLASEGRLTEEIEAEVAVAVRTHTDNAKREIEILRTEDADEATIASIALDTTLEVQSTAFKGEGEVLAMSDEMTISSQTSSLIADALDESRLETSQTEATSTLPAYDKLMARVEQNTTRLYEIRSSLSQIITPDEQVDVARRVEDVERSIGEAIAMAETDEAGAQRGLVDVLQRTQRLIVYMTELEVARTVDIETLVPVVPTDDEKRATIASTTAALNVKTEQISTLLPTVTVTEVYEKAVAGQNTIAELSAKMASSTEDFVTFSALSQEAHAIADDILNLLIQYQLPAEVSLPETTPEEETVASSTEGNQEEVEQASSTVEQSI
ncbi:MAG: hypothetical protein KBC35_01605 [Candidatus Pacebacteria bacterium]|nr:hypothetical protein [Candidatus Paceibacterota bacterium]